MSNAGRHYHPWNGRHASVLGIEDVTAYYHIGLAESAKKNPLSDKGYPTSLKLNARKPFTVNYIIGMTAVPAGFDIVKSIRPAVDGTLALTARSGRQATAKVDASFLYET